MSSTPRPKQGRATDFSFARFRYILLDPSCSGSGIVNRLDFLMEDREFISFCSGTSR